MFRSLCYLGEDSISAVQGLDVLIPNPLLRFNMETTS